MPGPEARIEQRLRRGLEPLGVEFVKFTTTERGWPDRLALLPGGRVIWVELKQPRGRVAAYQQHIHNRLRGKGFDVRVLSSDAEADKFIKEMHSATSP